MSLVRQQIPSPNYNAGRPSSRLLVVHTSEGATTYQNLGNFLAQRSSQVSYQVGWDDFTANTCGEYVRHQDTAWAAMAANSWGEHGCCCTPSGASQGWSRDTWLSKKTMLNNCKQWIAEECARYNIPNIKIHAGDISAGRSGVCGHGDCSAAGAGGSHTDPGPNFPWDIVVGGLATAPPTTGVPVFPGTLLINFTTGHGTRTWQGQMGARGWTIDVDDMYGSQSEHVCRQFQSEKGLSVDGIVGPITWDAAWTAPVT